MVGGERSGEEEDNGVRCESCSRSRSRGVRLPADGYHFGRYAGSLVAHIAYIKSGLSRSVGRSQSLETAHIYDCPISCAGGCHTSSLSPCLAHAMHAVRCTIANSFESVVVGMLVSRRVRPLGVLLGPPIFRTRLSSRMSTRQDAASGMTSWSSKVACGCWCSFTWYILVG